jgi:hypothetical protein
MGSFFDFFMIANQSLTNCLLEDTNDLLEKIRRQGMTPAERKAEDARRARTTVLFCAAIAFALIILISAFFILSAYSYARVQQSEHDLLERQSRILESQSGKRGHGELEELGQLPRQSSERGASLICESDL